MKKSIQSLSLLLFFSLFFLATYRLSEGFPADIYLRIDPLLGINAVIAAWEIIPRVLWSLLLIGATLLIGRFFCAYICPVGAALDGLDGLVSGQDKRREMKSDTHLRTWKYGLLVVIIAAALAGASLAYVLDPIALLTRFSTFVIYPLAIACLNVLADLLRPFAQGAGWIGLAHVRYSQPVFYMTAATLLIFGAVIALSRLAPRFWCRYLCPLGALLSLISPLGLFKRKVSAACNRCMACREVCPMDAVTENPLHTRLPECIQCRACAGICPQKAISFPASFAGSGEYTRFDLSRRGFVASLAGGLTLGFVALQSPFALLQGKRQLIRPPGALPETAFLRTCIRCGECMKSCVTNTLQPSFWDAGMAGLWTPKLETRLAACEPNCAVCGNVCPTQAIRALPLEEKTCAKIGTAVLRKETCLVWAQDRMCLICDEICPYNAIVFRTVDGRRRPVVIASRCNGCGYCEQRCPVKGESAIVVVPDGEIRLREGSYVAEAKKLQLEFKPDPGDDRFVIEAAGITREEAKEKAGGVIPPERPAARKPRGFL